MSLPFPEYYFCTRFQLARPVAHWPDSFAIITAWPTTGERWPDAEIQKQVQRLKEVLEQRNCWRVEITGYSPIDQHAEPGWAVDLTFDEACTLGLSFRQHAIYWVKAEHLYVSCCDEQRAPYAVGHFHERLDSGNYPIQSCS